VQGQNGDDREDFKVYTEHPRLLLKPQRLKLLRRERERKSARWQQFELLVQGKAAMPEPAFADALMYQVSGDEAAGKRAVDWALASGSDLRQLALVFDWCQPLMSEPQKAAVAKKLRQGIDAAGTPDIPAVRSRVFAAIALADYGAYDAQQSVGNIVRGWWRGTLAPKLKNGAQVLRNAEVYPIYETMHVIRDNLNVDLRDDAAGYFKELPSDQLLAYYPAVYPAAENEYRIPAFNGKGEPDLKAAAMSRAAELSMVAYDNNAVESQFLQGWLIHDRFILRGPQGVPYEFLWANPYQPGLSYFHMPLLIHDRRTGRLFIRSSWEEDATWLGYWDHQAQIFDKGKIQPISLQAQKSSLILGEVAVMGGRPKMQFTVPGDGPVTYFIVGLKPKQVYSIEVDDEELAEANADVGGILTLDFKRKDTVGVRLAERRNN
jgi:hypothetical protein